MMTNYYHLICLAVSLVSANTFAQTHPVVFQEVDTQLTFWESMHGTEAGPLAVSGTTELTPNVARIKKFAFTQKNVRVVASTDYHLSHEADHPELFPEFKMFKAHAIVGTAGAEGSDRIPEVNLFPDNRQVIIPHHIMKNGAYVVAPVNLERIKKQILDPNKEIVIRKNGLNSYSVFANPRTEIIYKMLSPVAVFVYGVATDYCVHATAMALLERGYKVYVIEDAIAGITKEGVAKTKEEMIKNGATFVTTEKALELATSLAQNQAEQK